MGTAEERFSSLRQGRTWHPNSSGDRWILLQEVRRGSQTAGDLIQYRGAAQSPHHHHHTTTMNTFLTAEEILQLVTTGMVTLTEDLIVRMTESYEDSEWYNDPNNVMSRHHY